MLFNVRCKEIKMFEWLDPNNMIINLVVLVIGFVALIKGADIFVDGASDIAARLGVSGLVIGLTVVAMGTSAPELSVSVSAALSGSNAIAISNVVGSNIFNALIILGVCALMKPVPVMQDIKKRDFPVLLFAGLLLVFFSGFYILFGPKPDMSAGGDIAGQLFRVGGIIFLLVFIGYMIYTVRDAKKKQQKDENYEPQPLWKSVLFILLGIACIVVGGDGIVTSAKNLAIMWGMSETLVGLTIVAFGTSLPELVTSIVASAKGQNDMAIGNVIGSNIFNILLILGVSSSIKPIPVTVDSFIDATMMFGVSVIAYIFACTGKKFSRIEGGILVLVYAGYMTYAILRQ